jgi:hypothetical protein
MVPSSLVVSRIGYFGFGQKLNEVIALEWPIKTATGSNCFSMDHTRTYKSFNNDLSSKQENKLISSEFVRTILSLLPEASKVLSSFVAKSVISRWKYFLITHFVVYFFFFFFLFLLLKWKVEIEGTYIVSFECKEKITSECWPNFD